MGIIKDVKQSFISRIQNILIKRNISSSIFKLSENITGVEYTRWNIFNNKCMCRNDIIELMSLSKHNTVAFINMNAINNLRNNINIDNSNTKINTVSNIVLEYIRNMV